MAKSAEELHRVVIRFAGDSGDGMQLTGDRFTNVSAIIGNDLSTLPDFPAEIRAPAGTLFGVSGFQIHFSDEDILTPGDQPNVLVAMNPAALKTNLSDLPSGGMLIVNEDAFTESNLEKAGYAANPLEDGQLDSYQVFKIPMTSMTLEATKDIDGITKKDAERAKNMFALGLVSWMYTRPTEPTIDVAREDDSRSAAHRRGERRRLQGRPQLRRDRRALRASSRSSRRRCRPGPTGTSPVRPRWRRV